MQMMFGKHKGENLRDLPDAYLYWLTDLDDLREPLRSSVFRECRRRESADQEQSVRITPLRAPEPDVVKQVHHRLALRYHPDRAGDVGIMQGINIFFDELKKACAR